jgi:hypothetical protein
MTTGIGWFADPDAVAAWLMLAAAFGLVCLMPRETLARQWRALTRGVEE